MFMSKKDKEVVSKQKESPFLLVEHGKDGLWYVLESPFNTAGISFNERQRCLRLRKRARTDQERLDGSASRTGGASQIPARVNTLSA